MKGAKQASIRTASFSFLPDMFAPATQSSSKRRPDRQSRPDLIEQVGSGSKKIEFSFSQPKRYRTRTIPRIRQFFLGCCPREFPVPLRRAGVLTPP